jgi:hypothetical protein
MIGLCLYAEGSHEMRVLVADENRPPSVLLHWDNVRARSADRQKEMMGLPDRMIYQIVHMNINHFRFMATTRG